MTVKCYKNTSTVSYLCYFPIAAITNCHKHNAVQGPTWVSGVSHSGIRSAIICLEQWFSTCGLHPNWKTSLSRNIYIVILNTRLQLWIRKKIILWFGLTTWGLQHQEGWEPLLLKPPSSFLHCPFLYLHRHQFKLFVIFPSHDMSPIAALSWGHFWLH